jgi:hypothetical protein
MSLIRPMEWIANRTGSITPLRPPMLYVGAPVAPRPGEILATCRDCGRAMTFAADEPAVPVCTEHDSPIVLSRDPEPIVMFNITRALRWWNWLHVGIPQCVWIMPWYVNVIANGEGDPMLVEQGLRDDCEVARRCDAFMACGPRISSGMMKEARASHEVGNECFQIEGFAKEPSRINLAHEAPWRLWVPS